MSYTNKDFNPSGAAKVAVLNDAAEALAEAIEALCPEGALKDKAIIDAQSSSMFAVKSLFS